MINEVSITAGWKRALCFFCQGIYFKFTPADNEFHHVNEKFHKGLLYLSLQHIKFLYN